MKRALLQPRSLSTGWALASVGGYLASFVLFLIGLNIAVVLAWWGLASAGTFALADLASLSASPMPSGLLLVTTLVQFFGMLGLAIGGWRLISALHRQRGIPTDSASRAFGFRSAKPVAYAAALAGGLTVGWFPGWLAAVLRDALPWLDLGAVELITAHLEQGPALTRVGMLIVIGVLGPIVEELVFRGWLWRSLRRSFSGPVVILITSVLFSLVHLDPAQAIPLLFTGAFLGWARWTTGSIWTAVVIHVANNLLAIYSQLFGLSEVSSSLVALSVVGTLFLASLMWRHQTTPAMA